MEMKRIFFLMILCAALLHSVKSNADSLDISGDWAYRLDPADVGITERWFEHTFSDILSLPGTLDDAGIGSPVNVQPTFDAPQIRHLMRKVSYIGPAWYSKEIMIPEDMAGKPIEVLFERVLWKSQLWVDGRSCGVQESLSVPHRYTLPPLSKGTHRFVFRIDNRAQHDISVVNMGHCYTDDTQIIWNGVLGDMTLRPLQETEISDIALFPNPETSSVGVKVKINSGKAKRITLNFEVSSEDTTIAERRIIQKLSEGETIIEYVYEFSEFDLWDEFNPKVYTMKVRLGKGNDPVERTFGFRTMDNTEGRLSINGRPLFLRGTLESCVFPLTGTPPMDCASWERVFSIARDYGLNHIRFHSWCPPEAAFAVADSMGFYLQVELPWWSYSVGQDAATNDFAWAEALAIMNEYGNHPSFCLWSMGNELEGDIDMLQNFVRVLKEQDERHLYTTTSFTFQKGAGSVALPCDDYLVTQWTDWGWVRGQGIFNDYSPSFMSNYETAIDSVDVPVIAHEVGQYCIYPRMSEIDKYTGVLQPLNMIAVRNDLEKKGLLGKADDYVMASGKLAVSLYKEEIERYLRTENFGGFQLLDLHDYPGQGTALVGILDAFWDSKGLVSPEEWRGFCSEVVPLMKYPKAVYDNSETFEAEIMVANYWNKDIDNAVIEWKLSGKDGCFKSGVLEGIDLRLGLNDLGRVVSVPLSSVNHAQQVKISLSVKGTSYKNSWNIWVYPSSQKEDEAGIVVTQNVDTAMTALSEGRKVLFNPDWKYVDGIEGMYLPVFWSPVHFPNQAGTMGILCNPEHPALADFPTDCHTDWQWWDIVKNSKTMVLDSLPRVTPIIEVVDNFLKNRKLAIAFEARSGNGSLVMVSADISSNLDDRPVARQLRNSLLQYMKSAKFSPEHEIGPEHVAGMINNEADDFKSSSTRIYE